MSIATATAALFTNFLVGLKTRIKPGIEPVVEHEKSYERPVPQLGGKYKLRITPVSMGPGHWSTNVVEIIDTATSVSLGHYERNYSCFYNTFYPFKQADREFALYSRDYTSTRVMSLPDCVDIAGEDPHGFGFCPTGFYVPQPEDGQKTCDDGPNLALDGTFGFVCGCVWGDDNSWKIQHLDLSKITEGVLKREARFGYLELADDCDNLKDAIDLSDYEGPSCRSVKVKMAISFDVGRAVDIDWSSQVYNAYEKQADAADPTRVQKCATEGCAHVGKHHVRADKSCIICKCTCKAFVTSGVVDPAEMGDSD
jgi:hypothetical protein